MSSNHTSYDQGARMSCDQRPFERGASTNEVQVIKGCSKEVRPSLFFVVESASTERGANDRRVAPTKARYERGASPRHDVSRASSLLCSTTNPGHRINTAASVVVALCRQKSSRHRQGVSQPPPSKESQHSTSRMPTGRPEYRSRHRQEYRSTRHLDKSSRRRDCWRNGHPPSRASQLTVGETTTTTVQSIAARPSIHADADADGRE